MKISNNTNQSLKYLFVLICLLGFNFYSFGQNKTVQEIFKESQKAMKSFSSMRCDMNYNWYNSYTSEKPSIIYKGNIVKQNDVLYSKINETFFLTDTNNQIGLKCNTLQKALVVTKGNIPNNQSPSELLETYIKQFKITDVKDFGKFWMCTLTTDVITQLPYGKVEVYIDKETYLVSKQVLYFLSQVPYTSKKGEQKVGSPKLEITMFDYQSKLTPQEKALTELSTYIKKKDNTILPATAYKEFKIIQ